MSDDDRYNSDGSGSANDYSAPDGQTTSSYPTYDQGTELEVDREELRRIADDLEADLEQLRPALNRVMGVGGSIQASHLGGSPTAREVVQTTNAAYQGFKQYYGDLSRVYTDLIRRLRASADNYGEAEGQTTAAANQVATGTDAPTTANRGGWE